MCIAIISTAHPRYALILINNRDEFLNRPTKAADWWAQPDTNVIGGRDLLRAEQGTWLGMTREGRLAVLTNFREDGVVPLEVKSRGALVTAFLTQSPEDEHGTEAFVKSLMEKDGLAGFGGFSLICGKVGESLAVVSNRTPSVEDVTWIAKEKGETIGLSNAAIADRTWTKVTRGERLMKQAIDVHTANKGSQEALLEALFAILSDDTLPMNQMEKNWESRVKELRKSIFIPAVGGQGTHEQVAEDLAATRLDESVSFGPTERQSPDLVGMSGAYGTQKQTVILVSYEGKVTFVERSLYDASVQPTKGDERDRMINFDIQKS